MKKFFEKHGFSRATFSQTNGVVKHKMFHKTEKIDIVFTYCAKTDRLKFNFTSKGNYGELVSEKYTELKDFEKNFESFGKYVSALRSVNLEPELRPEFVEKVEKIMEKKPIKVDNLRKRYE
ncbi:hypothetical protein HNP89_000593 [Methanococcus maripaludis]|uniref:Uncharacterized protein n=1 Tax=Methanococcus maripaludis TaxID=39152 RepID=A0A7J9P3L7_METMI|nr:DUF2683 family protein [Methanococcus maripaludis]MBA2852656.1 hypothetical protein [Methanococcus maripaludis]